MSQTYRTVEAIAAQIQALADRFPALCTLVTYAPDSGRSQTWENRPLQSLRIRSTAADRKAVVVVAGQHGETADVYGEIGAGVDLNRNYDIGWGPLFYAQSWPADRMVATNKPCDDTYSGPSAASEPETLHIQRLVDQVKPRYVLDIHTG